MTKSNWKILDNGTIVTDSVANDVMLREMTCSVCGFVQRTIMSGYQADRLWGFSHGFQTH